MTTPEQPKNGIDVTKIVGIVCGAILVIAVLTYFAFNDWVSSQTPVEQRYQSPVLNQLPLFFTFIATTIGGFIGNALIQGKLAKKVEEVAEKTEKIEKQTNGRTHVRDAENAALMNILKRGFSTTGDVSESIEKAISTPKNNDNAPEDSFNDEELQIQIQMIQLANKLHEAKQRKEGKK